jgi:hypothetical protein
VAGARPSARPYEYHLTASLGALDVAQKNREDFLYTFYLMGRDAIRAGEAGGPFAYVVSLADQHDPGEAVEMLNGAAPRRDRGAPRGVVLPGGGAAVPGGELRGVRGAGIPRAPAGHDGAAGAPPPRSLSRRSPRAAVRGLAGYTLPIQMGVESARIDRPFQAATERVDEVPAPLARLTGSGDVVLLAARENRSFTGLHAAMGAGARVSRAAEAFDADGRRFPAGTLVIEGEGASSLDALETAVQAHGLSAYRTAQAPAVSLRQVRAPGIGIYQPYTGNMDEGWTRWLFNHYAIPFRTVSNEQIRSGDLGSIDVILFTGQPAGSIMRGHREGRMPARFVGGIEEDGVEALRAFVRGGGRLVALDNANDFLLEHFDVPVENALDGLGREDFYIPGSLVGSPSMLTTRSASGCTETAAFFQSSRAFEVTGPGPQAVARYGERDLLLSGWEVGAEEHLAGRTAVARAPYGEGDLVLIGFRPSSGPSRPPPSSSSSTRCTGRPREREPRRRHRAMRWRQGGDRLRTMKLRSPAALLAGGLPSSLRRLAPISHRR